MISNAMKFKILRSLSCGPMSRTEVGDMFRSRTAEYRESAFDWLDNLTSVKFKLQEVGRPAEFFMLNTQGADELDRLKSACMEN